MNAYILTLSCPDRPGIVHAVSGFLLKHQANIEEAAQYSDPATGLFFMRVRFSCELATSALTAELTPEASSLGLQWQLHEVHHAMSTVLFVSKEGHCLNDLLFRTQSGLLPISVKAIISNHRDFYQLADVHRKPHLRARGLSFEL